jgi:hypothetical protein
MTLPNPDDKTHVVYTTQQPDVRLVIDEREYAELKAQGLIAREGRHTDKDPAPATDLGQKPA